ncbi:sugar phosphate isomerase/epimerase family protein [Peribacillus simplex]|uniref:Sugar phosphate isomerase/epimerase family protein n=2 Tax=Peribacillus TaxID=2675229 RepID=A0AA90PF79_9BACI|nr:MULTISPECIES: sugar phosphate isomerase/epimerase family protein [Peribacillus]MDP1422037.1 sugar phosphate isomerase/epimerase family protein [Peribacillus simplex]MDP1454713.1 sugar phosphate isomerase/epimerase family protein [Peribacillus frigoritolerans]
MKIGLETESYHLQFITGRMDIFGFIRKTAELGLDGVMINIVPWPGLSGWGTLESFEPEYLERVRKEIQKYGFFAEIDTNGSNPEHLKEVIEAAHRIGADVIRTYTCLGEYEPEKLKKAPGDIKQIVPLLEKYRIKLAVENHEEELADEVIQIINEVNSPWVSAHCDVGNGMMAWEDPVEAVRKLAPYAFTTHFKDHIIIHDGKDYRVCGVPVGTGNIDTEECFKILVKESTLTRINVEMCFPYAINFKRELGAGGVFAVGEGAFKVEQPPYDLSVIKPLDYYYPPKELLEQMIEDQEKGTVQSVKYTLALRDKYCR